MNSNEMIASVLEEVSSRDEVRSGRGSCSAISAQSDLQDDEKRWLVVGICLHSVISPVLRKSVEPTVKKLYNQLKTSHKIDTQTHPNVLKFYPVAPGPGQQSYRLNYESINYNRQHGKKTNLFDYKVKDAVDFSKLFVLPHMAHYTGFDLSCDSSALLGLILNMDGFPQPLKLSADNVRRDFRNAWAHCNYQDWDQIRFMQCFTLMIQLVRNLQLPVQEATDALNLLTKWQCTGLQFLSGTTLGLEVLGDMKKEVTALAKYLLHADEKFSTDLKKASDQISRVDNIMSVIVTKLEKLEENQGHLGSSVRTLYQRQNDVDKQLNEVGTNQAAFTKGLQSLEADLNAVQTEQKEKVRELSDSIGEIKDRVSNLELYRCLKRPDKIFFYPPDRLKYFLGRKEELEMLEDAFLKNYKETEPYVQVVCGLGGSGKTSLAVEYAWLTQNYYPGGVYWVSAEQTNIFENSINRLASDAETIGRDSRETLSLTLKWLGNLSSRWLLVVDNIDQEELSNEIKELLMGPWRRGSKGQFLITTRREVDEAEETFKVNVEECVVLGPMSAEESVEFMIQRTGKNALDAPDESLHLLVDELGGLPLAMEQAAAHIKTLKCSFKDYLERFKKKRLKLSHNRDISTTQSISKERLAVTTTWKMNFDYICKQSEDEGLGNSVPFVMNVTGFLYADDIPEELLNKGEPEIDDTDFQDAMEDTVGVKQVIGILTRFSLFQRGREGSFQVHRLVQEVVRDNISDVNYKANVIHAAVKMLHSALKNTKSPLEVLEVQEEPEKLRGQLCLWSRLGMTSCTLRNHINSFVQLNGFEKELLWNFETLKVFQTSAIFHSIYQRQAEALSAQSEMLHMMSLSEVTEKQEKDLIGVTIPVHDLEKKTIQACIESNISLNESEEINTFLDPDALRQMGNKAYQEKREQDAIQLYTCGIKASHVGKIDTRLYTNRSLCFLKIQNFERALEDADSCIAIEPGNWKAHCWRAYAIGHLVEAGKKPKSMETAGLASASVAGFLNPKSKLQLKMKIFYPILISRVVADSHSLQNAFTDLSNQPYTTLLLRTGKYKMKCITAAKSIQLIGIDNKVEIFIDRILQIFPLTTGKAMLQIHFENIYFVKGGGQILASGNTTLIFNRCRFSNGAEGCKDYPQCRGGEGCINPDPTGCSCQRPGGVVAEPGLCAKLGGQIVLESCILDGCGGGGALSAHKGSILNVKNCLIQNNRASGLEARESGILYAVNNTVQNNKMHGIMIGPYGKADVKHNYIAGNGWEGIFGLEETTEVGMAVPAPIKQDSKTEGVFEDNVIAQNGFCGISLDGGTFIINGNKILENWCWGILAKTRASCHLTNNDIYNNKCGGVSIGYNYSATIYFDGNTIRDHTGPHLHIRNVPFEMKSGVPEDEITHYTSPPIITNRNVFRHNQMGIQRPSVELLVANVCAFCHKKGKNMKSCASCRKAFYCNLQCQKNHWKRHKLFCKLFNAKFTVSIMMKNTKPVTEAEAVFALVLNQFLKEIKNGPKPDLKRSKLFIVKIQSGSEYSKYDPQTEIMLSDRSTELCIKFRCPELYLMMVECGMLETESYTKKKIFCWASFEKKGEILKVYTDKLPPFEEW